MATLIHLNGPACVGKSTIAGALVASRPMALNLDIDRIRTSLGGWEADPGSKGVARARGFEMAGAHLAAGYDVVMPALIMAPEWIDRIVSLADGPGAEIMELALIADLDELVARIVPTPGGHPRDEFSGIELRGQMEHCLRELPALLDGRAYARLVDVSGLSGEAALEAVRSTIETF